jgi:hypothetical protein
MTIGQAYALYLTRCEREALATGCDLLIDQAFDDLDNILHMGQENIADTTLALYLPPRYLPKYTPHFLKQFLVCIITVAWKLAQPEHHPLSSVAEELAAFALIQHSRVPIELEKGWDAAERAFARFIDGYFEDTDFLFLFNDELDGIDTSPVGQMVGILSLAFEDWFRPFSSEPSRIAHPYAHGD